MDIFIVMGLLFIAIGIIIVCTISWDWEIEERQRKFGGRPHGVG